MRKKAEEMRKTLETDRLLREKYKSARIALPLYIRLFKQYCLRPPKLEKVTEILKQNPDLRLFGPTAFIFQPDGNSDEAVFSLTCLKQLYITIDPRQVVVITTNADMADYVKLFDETAIVEVISEETAQDLLNLALMIPFDDFFYIASLNKPYGRWGDKVLQKHMAGAERCFATGVYRVWHYSPEPLPSYEGDDQRILAFLDRARHLQEESVLIDKEAQENYA